MLNLKSARAFPHTSGGNPKILGVSDSFRAADKMMSILSDEGSRLFIFNRFLQIENKLDDDWFRKYFETEQAERKKKKQDFTPKSAIAVLNQLIGNDGSSYYDIILQRLIQFNYPKKCCA
nr:hypothetical protein [Ligilactobacillus agilis]